MARNDAVLHGGTTGPGLDSPLSARRRRLPRMTPNPDAFGQATEGIARFMGTPQFLLWMTMFCLLWLGWNTVAPEPLRFDSAALGFTALTLMLSLQASYAAPLLLLAQNRQDDRDRVSMREDRARAERNLADTEYLTRELAGLRIALQDVATRDFVRSEMRSAVEEITDELTEEFADRIRARVRTDVLDQLREDGPPAEETDADDGSPQNKTKKRDRAARESRDRGGRESRERSDRDRADGSADGPQTTTLAIIAAEEVARQDQAETPGSDDEPPRPGARPTTRDETQERTPDDDHHD